MRKTKLNRKNLDEEENKENGSEVNEENCGQEIIEEESLENEDTNENEEKNKKVIKKTKSEKKSKKDKKKAEFEVDQIVDMDINQRRRSVANFRVRWVGFTEKDDTWLPYFQLLNCQKVVDEFLEISGRKPEFERALTAKQDSLTAVRHSDRTKYAKNYEDEEEEEETYIPTGTRTRVAVRAVFDQSVAKKPKHKPVHKKAKEPKIEKVRNLEREYEVEKILNLRANNGDIEYKVRWRGFDSKQDSWLPETELKSCSKILNQFKATLNKLEDVDYDEDESPKGKAKGHKKAQKKSPKRKLTIRENSDEEESEEDDKTDDEDYQGSTKTKVKAAKPAKSAAKAKKAKTKAKTVVNGDAEENVGRGKSRRKSAQVSFSEFYNE